MKRGLKHFSRFAVHSKKQILPFCDLNKNTLPEDPVLGTCYTLVFLVYLLKVVPDIPNAASQIFI
jgi:hypothetical protein